MQANTGESTRLISLRRHNTQAVRVLPVIGNPHAVTSDMTSLLSGIAKAAAWQQGAGSLNRAARRKGV